MVKSLGINGFLSSHKNANTPNTVGIEISLHFYGLATIPQYDQYGYIRYIAFDPGTNGYKWYLYGSYVLTHNKLTF